MIFPDMNTELLSIIYNNEWITPSEKRVLQLKYQEGLCNYQIAMEMNASKETIGRILKRIYRKVQPIIVEYFNKHPEYTDNPA